MVEPNPYDPPNDTKPEGLDVPTQKPAEVSGTLIVVALILLVLLAVVVPLGVSAWFLIGFLGQ
ncbi:MAG: hypothetical protein AAGJ83_02920 [Planctomycetota bacterium]